MTWQPEPPSPVLSHFHARVHSCSVHPPTCVSCLNCSMTQQRYTVKSQSVFERHLKILNPFWNWPGCKWLFFYTVLWQIVCLWFWFKVTCLFLCKIVRDSRWCNYEESCINCSCSKVIVYTLFFLPWQEGFGFQVRNVSRNELETLLFLMHYDAFVDIARKQGSMVVQHCHLSAVVCFYTSALW